jgi:MATE family multidrug resistance protein
LSAHPFERRPHHTLLTLSLPVMLSLVAEPLAGLVDTAFVERLGAASAAALGAATALLSSFLWVFNFLGVGTQTEVALAIGRQRRDDARAASSLALGLAFAVGCIVAGAAVFGVEPGAAWMSDDPEVRAATTVYLQVRLVGFPAGLVLLAAFGALRGLQDMRTPMWIAGAMSALNVVLDPLLIFGWGPIPTLGIAGAAWATVASQGIAAVAACAAVVSRLGFRYEVDARRALALFVVGRDMVIRTAALLAFMLVATRVALQMGPASGAANQAIRQVFMLLAFLLDAYAASTQSLVAGFMGGARIDLARRVATVGMQWALVTGFALAGMLWLAEPAVAALLVPPESRAVFAAAWPVFAAAQPLAAVSFLSDGVHWGTGDFAWLRNGMLVSTAVGLLLITRVDTARPALDVVWAITALWLGVRSALGLVRIWPGARSAPLGTCAQQRPPDRTPRTTPQR